MKQRIRESFNRAANSYDSAASIQRRICERLLAAHELCLAPSPDILDAGCGTGYGTRLMQKKWPGARISAVDFAPTMLEIAREEPGHYLAADDAGRTGANPCERFTPTRAKRSPASCATA